MLYVPFGQTVLQTISAGVSQILVFADDGIEFLFGGLADADEVGFVFAIKVLPVIIFFSSLIAVLYYLGIMQWVIRILGGALQRRWAPRVPSRFPLPRTSSLAKPKRPWWCVRLSPA